MSSTCPHNMVNFGPLSAEILSLVWGTPANFNGFRVLASLLHGILVVGVNQIAALNRGRGGRATITLGIGHISSFILFLSSFLFPRLISAVADWMSAILLHMAWP